ncbi:MAG: hypothetical protein P1P87_10660 [Trueperaceae bacterium]|nr:hypothetical protein [Trueperaceae bacterium]
MAGRLLAGHTIGVYGSGGAPWHHLALAAAAGATVRPVRAEDVAAGRLAELDALIVPGGGAIAMAGLLAPLGEAGAEAIAAWVRAGGAYVASCAGSVLPLALRGAADESLPLARCLRMVDVPMANEGDATLGGLASPGVGRIRVRLDPAHPFTAGLPDEIDIVHYNGPLFDLSRVPAGVRPFAWPVAATAAFTPAERFLPGGPAGASTFERCVAARAATGLEADVGEGRLLLFGSHPEFGLGPLLLGWGDAAALLVAALASLEARAAAPAAGDPGWTVRSEHGRRPPSDLARDATAALVRAAARFEALTASAPDAWLAPEQAAAFHGRDARTAWPEDAAAAARIALAAASDLRALAPRMGAADAPWLDDAPRADQDFGWMGLLQLLARVHAMLDAAKAAPEAPEARPAHAYDPFDRHPFHLAVGSYLSAAGLISAAALTVVVLAARHDAATPALAPHLSASA